MTDRRLILLAALLGAAFHGFLGVWLGQDFNYDRLNYHDYLGWKLFSGLPFDWNLPANYLQAWLNPLPYAPHHLLHAWFGPWWAQLILGMMQGLLGGLITAIALKLLKPEAPHRRWLALGAVMVGLTGPMLVSEAGTSFVDGLLGLFVLGGLWFIIGKEPRPRDAFCAALLIGLGFGLKSTMAMYAVGLAAALLVSRDGFPSRRPSWKIGLIPLAFVALSAAIDIRHSPIFMFFWCMLGITILAMLLFPMFRGVKGSWLSPLLAAALGGLTGWIVTGGWHACQLLWTFSSPVWPYFSGGGTGDTRFIPESLREGLAYPWLIAVGEGPTSELGFADPRWLAILLATLLWLAMPARRTEAAGGWLRHRADARVLLAFMIGSWLPWIGLFGLERFLAPLEAASGLMLLALIADSRLRPQITLACCLVAAGLVPAFSRPPDLMRADWTVEGYQADLAGIPDNLLAVLEPGRFSYLAPLLPAGTRIVSFGDDGMMTRDIVNAHAGPIMLISSGAGTRPIERGRLYKLNLDLVGDCRDLRTRLDTLRACRLKRAGTRFYPLPETPSPSLPDPAAYRRPDSDPAIYDGVPLGPSENKALLEIERDRLTCPETVRIDITINGRRVATGVKSAARIEIDLAGLTEQGLRYDDFRLLKRTDRASLLTFALVARADDDRHRFDRPACTGVRIKGLWLTTQRQTGP